MKFIALTSPSADITLNAERIAWLQKSDETGTRVYFSATHDDYIWVKEDIQTVLELAYNNPPLSR